MKIPTITETPQGDLPLPQLSETKRKEVNRLTKAAEEGMKELHVDGSGDTIVHDVVQLKDYRIFRAVFKQGTVYLNTPNAQGATPLLEAVRLGEYQLVQELLKRGASDVINTPNKQGLTPLHAAVELGNHKLVKLLLSHGASDSINTQTNIPNEEDDLYDQKNTPLHTAVLQKDDKMIKLLLKSGAANSINTLDAQGLTPKQRAIISGQVHAVKAMLDASPEAASTVNQPDQRFGVTDIQRASRSGNLEMYSLLISYLGIQEIKNNPSSFASEEIESCEAASEVEAIKSFPIEKIGFPLVIAQNFCSTMIRLADGNILRLKHSDAKEVRDYLMHKKYGDEWKNDHGANVLTLYVAPGHGFTRLECQNCDDGQPFNMNRGFYPTDRILRNEPSEPQTKEEKKPVFRSAGTPAIAASPYSENDETLEMIPTEEANLIFTIARNDNTVTMNSSSGNSITIPNEDFRFILKSIFNNDLPPRKIAETIHDRLTQMASDGGDPPDLRVIDEIIRELHHSKVASGIIARWIQDTLVKPNASGQGHTTLDGNEIVKIVDYLLNPTEQPSHLGSIFNSFLEQISLKEAIVPPITLLNTNPESISKLFVDIASGSPLEEIASNYFGKKNSDEQSIERLSAQEASKIAQWITEGTIGIIDLNSMIVNALNSAQTLLGATLMILPSSTTLLHPVSVAKENVGHYLWEVKRYLKQELKKGYLLTQERAGRVGNEDWYENHSDTKNLLKIMFYLSDEQAKGALDTIKGVTLSCKENPEKSCRYFLTQRNCVDFVREVYHGTGATGEFADFFTDEQLAQGHLHAPSQIHEFRAVNYAYLRSRGMHPSYLENLNRLNQVYNSVGSFLNWEPDYFKAEHFPHKISSIQELLPSQIALSQTPTALATFPEPLNPQQSSNEIPDESPSISRPYSASGADQVSLAVVVGKMAYNCFTSLSSFLSQKVGEKASLNEAEELCKTGMEILGKGFALIDPLEEIIDDAKSDLEAEIVRHSNFDDNGDLIPVYTEEQKIAVDKYNRELAKLSKANSLWVDLTFKGVEINEQLTKLERSTSTPTKKFLDDLQMQLDTFKRECNELHSQLLNL